VKYPEINSRAYRWRGLATLAVLAALWSVVELSLGNAMIALQLPLRGAFLTALALPLMFAARLAVPRTGSVAALGLTTAAVRWLLGGAFIPQVSVAIAVEALLAETGLGWFRNPGGITRPRAALAGGLALAYTAAHPVLFWGLLLGGAHAFRLPEGFPGLTIFAAILTAHFVAGGAAGIWALGLVKRFSFPVRPASSPSPL
jgi:hypothetical protein